MRVVTRRKVLIVPYIGKNIERVLMVKDLKTGEWGFISGGVKKRESSYEAALREMSEETSGLFVAFDSTPSVHTFCTLYRPPELLKIDRARREIVRSMYTIYMYELCPTSRVDNFVPNKEVIDVNIKPFQEYKNVWSFCNDVYINFISKQFKNKSNSSKKTYDTYLEDM